MQKNVKAEVSRVISLDKRCSYKKIDKNQDTFYTKEVLEVLTASVYVSATYDNSLVSVQEIKKLA